MASLGNACRRTVRLAGSQLRNHASSRGFRTGSANLAAHNFTMPAMSPTMTEGNISSWKVKEGESFAAGDILLEIETDKAQMEVEAQDDGILAKITQGDGSKSVKVGSRIGVLADSGDDISSLEIPTEEPPKTSTQSAKQDTSKPEPPKQAESKSQDIGNMPSSAGKPKEQTYPLYPSVQHLLLQNGLGKDEANKIPATGPNGRVLKGDVLAYLGRIDKSYSAQQSSRIAKLGHLDLSNIKLAPPPAKRESAASTEAALPVEDIPVELSLPISLKAVLQVQQRVQKTLGISLPTTTFLARAIDLANDGLPLAKGRKLSSDELFNSVLGLDQFAPRTSTGTFVPEIAPFEFTAPLPRPQKKVDLFDEILGAKRRTPASSVVMPAQAPAEAVNIFSVTAFKGEEDRAKVFLEQLKAVLEVDPGRLVL